MTPSLREWRRKYLLPLSLGIADGIVNALSLASSSVLHGRGLTFGLGLRVGIVAQVTTVFTVFVAEYAQLRADLTRAEHELNLTRSGRFAAGVLGRQVAIEAATACLVASLSSFAGAFTPLLIGALVHPFPATALIVSVAALGVLGWLLASLVHGRRWLWVSCMVGMGAIVAVVGVALDIA